MFQKVQCFWPVSAFRNESALKGSFFKNGGKIEQDSQSVVLDFMLGQSAAFHVCLCFFVVVVVVVHLKRPTRDGLSDSTGICRRPTTRAETMPCPQPPTTSQRRRRRSRRGRPLPGYAPPCSHAHGTVTHRVPVARTQVRAGVSAVPSKSRCCVTGCRRGEAVALGASHPSPFQRPHPPARTRQARMEWTRSANSSAIDSHLHANCYTSNEQFCKKKQEKKNMTSRRRHGYNSQVMLASFCHPRKCGSPNVGEFGSLTPSDCRNTEKKQRFIL